MGFSILFTFVLALALVLIYVSLANFRKDEFNKRLKDKALTTFKLLVEVVQIDNDLLQVIDKNTLNSLYDEKVLVFKNNILVYSSLDDMKIQYGPELLAKTKEKGEFYTTQGQNEIAALYVEQNSDQYIILASASDGVGKRVMNFMKWVMIAVYCSGLVVGWLSTYFFVKKIIHPLEILKIKLKNINYDSLDADLPETGQGEEVDSLSSNFNQMLARLEQSFSFQKDFIHYASHELRTPLAAMVSLTENSINVTRTPEEYQEILKKLFQQEKNLTDVTNSLLLLSDNKVTSKGHEFPSVRLDELVFKSVEITKNIFPKAKIEVNLEGDFSNENFLVIHAIEPLMLMAFNNLLKNAIQYSFENEVRIIIRMSEKEKEIQFFNSGNSLDEQEKEKVFIPFYRGSNAAMTKGYGLGLPFVKQIVQLHGAAISYSYEKNTNVFRILFRDTE